MSRNPSGVACFVMLPAWEDVPSSGFRCPRRDCRPAEDGWSSRILIEKPVSVGTRVQLLCPTCRAQLFPCDCCAALVCKDESSSQGALGQRATCRLCGTCTVLGDSERLILGLEPILALSPEDALRQGLLSPRVKLSFCF